MIAEIYIIGVFVFTGIALHERQKYGQSFTFDLFTTILIILWPITLLLMVAQNIMAKGR